MSEKLRAAQFADRKGTVVEGHLRNLPILCEGPLTTTGNSAPTGIPADGTVGWEEGCLWVVRGGLPGGQLYMNEGTQAACAFRPFAQQSILGLSLPKNILDGGDFTTNPWQRGTVQAADITNTLTYGPDRWFIVAGASSAIDFSKTTDGTLAGFANAFRVQRKATNTDVTTIVVGEVVETLDSIKTQGQTITFSFWAKAQANYSGGKLTVQVNHSLVAGNDTAAHLVAASTNWQATPTIVNTTQAITTSWVRYSFSGVVPAGCQQLGVLLQWTPTGTAGTTDAIDFQGFQLEVGGAASAFEHLDAQEVLAICQRYFVAMPEPANGVIVASGMITGAAVEVYVIGLPTTMLSSPTVTLNAGSYKVNLAGTATAPTTLAPGTTHSQNQVSVTAANTGQTAGQATLLQGGGGSGYIRMSADF